MRGPRRPTGYDPGVQWAERSVGCLVALLGAAGLVLAVVLWRAGGGPLPGEPGLAAQRPLACLLPLVALGGLGLVLVGLRRMVDP